MTPSRWRAQERLGPLVLISDAARVGEERFFAILREAVRGGVRAVQVREKSWDDERVGRFVRRVRAEHGTALAIVLNGSPSLAVELAVDGLHVGGGDPRAAGLARNAIGPEMLLGYSAHRLGELPIAERYGVDYVSFSPVFSPISKAVASAPIGLDGLREAVRRTSVAVYALGGVTARHGSALREAGAEGAAVIGALTGAGDPAGEARAFLAGWRRGGEPEERAGDEPPGV